MVGFAAPPNAADGAVRLRVVFSEKLFRKEKNKLIFRKVLRIYKELFQKFLEWGLG